MDQRVRAILELDADISKAKGSISQLSQVFSNMGGGKSSGLLNTLGQIEKEIDKLASKSGTSVTKIGDFSSAETSTEKISNLIKKLSNDINSLGKASGKDLEKLFPPSVAANVKKASDAVQTYQNIMKKSQSSTGAIGKATNEYNKQSDIVKKLTNNIQELEAKKQTGKPVTADGLKEQEKKVKELNAAYDEQIKKVQQLQQAKQKHAETGGIGVGQTKRGTGPIKDPANNPKQKQFTKEIAEAQQKAEQLKLSAQQANTELQKMYVPSKLDGELQTARGALEQASVKAQELKNNLNNVTADEANRALEQAKTKLQEITGIDLSNINSLQDLQNIFEQITQNGIDKFKQSLGQARSGVDELTGSNNSMKSSISQSRAQIEAQNRALEDVNGLKSRIQYFFSLTNGAMLARRAIQQAFEAVKELDAAMTETAVVTDFDVGDMWDALPRYTETANKLGATTLGAYETMTLFYQQGLDTNEVFEIGTETMKMARIAGLEYADATNLMTAALRGFNMELNETSAQRINDVYSELAAITAADTNEIATAMTKTASIANSANMEFETTAALLSQIIETTREPAETAGTAMKTIIARFTEMKKATSDLINVEGEEVSVNKVDAALKSVGVSLKNTNGEFRNLDEVFLELAEKWDSLDLMSQRYVATMAAGSRQQSRFIAMMSDYDRTMELVNAAYDSAGASAAQFAKTQESVEAKLNTLSNAWNEFLMGIANSDLIKGVITVLTEFLNILNDLTAGSGSFTSSLLKIMSVFAGFQVLKGVFNGLMGQIAGTFLAGGKTAGQNFNTGLSSVVGKVKNNFPFFGTFRKELAQTGKDIKAFSKDGEISLSNLTKMLDTKSTGIRSNLAGGIGNQIKDNLMSQLNDIGTLTPAGQEWARGLIDGFVQEVSSGEVSMGKAVENLQNNFQQGLVSTQKKNIVGKDGSTKTITTKSFNKDYITNTTGSVNNIDSSQLFGNMQLDANKIKQQTQLTQDWSIALMSVGMAANMVGSSLEEMGGTAGKIGSGVSLIGNAATTAGMALMAASAAAKAFGTALSTGPLIIIAAVTSAISLLSGIITKHKEEIKATREETLKIAKDSQQEAETNRELANSLNEIIEKYKEGNATRGEVAEASEELIEKYGLEGEKVKLLTGDYNALTKAIRDKRVAEEEDNLAKQKNSAQASREELKDSDLNKIETLYAGLSISDEITDYEKLSKEAKEILTNLELDDYIKIDMSGSLSLSKSIDKFTDEELVKLSSFLKQYLAILGDQLKAEGKDLEDSEIYKKLANIINETDSSFENLKVSVDNATESLELLAKIKYEQQYDPSKVDSREEYLTERENYIAILKEENPNISENTANQLADNYFSGVDTTKNYVSSETLKTKIETSITGNPEDIKIYKDYVNGNISPETFVNLTLGIDFEYETDPEEINNLIDKQRVKLAIEAPDTFSKATEGITDYIGENFTIDGIDESVLKDFEAQLTVLNATLPEGSDLLSEWNDALSKGTLGISEFFIEVQSLLSNRSMELQQQALNTMVYGVAADSDTIKKDYERYNNASGEEKTQIEQELKTKYGIDDISTLETAYNNVGLDYDELLSQGEADLAAAKKAKIDKINSAEFKENYKALYGVDPTYTLDEDGNAILNKPEIVSGQGLYGQKKEIEGNIENQQSKVNYWNEQLDKYRGSSNKAHRTAGLGGNEYEDDAEKETNARTNLTNAQAGLENAQDQLTEFDKQYSDVIKDREAKITFEVEDQEIKDAENRLEAIKNSEHIHKQIELQVKLKDAQQIAVLRQQLAQIKELTKDSTKVDLSTFEQLKAITPEIARGVQVMADGTVDVSAGLDLVNAKLKQQLGLKQDAAETDIRAAMAKEQALQVELQSIIDAIDTELQAEQTGSKEKIKLQTNLSEKITSLKEDEAFKNAQIYDKQTDEMSESAAEGAQNVVNSVVDMETAYIQLGNTLDKLNEKMVNLGTEGYQAGAITPSVAGTTTSPSNENTPDESEFDFESLNPEDYELGDTVDREALEELRDYYQGLYDSSVIRSGQYASILSGMLGGGVKPEDGGGGGDAEELADLIGSPYASMNADRLLSNLDRQRTANDREADLISKLPSEIQGPFKLLNLVEDMGYEYQEIQINKNKQAALQGHLLAAEDKAQYLGQYYNYDEEADAYMYDVAAMDRDNLSQEKRAEIEKELNTLQEINDQLNAVEDELDGGKIQKIFRGLEKGSKGVQKVLKQEGKTRQNVNKAFDVLEKKLGLNDKTFDKFADNIANAIDSSDALNATFEGLNDEGDALIDQLEKSPLGKMLGESSKEVLNLLKNGGTNRQMGGALAGMGGEMFGKIGDLMNFDMLGMGLDGMNIMKGMMDQGKQMAEQAAQYICQAIQVVVDAITNREDILFNYLNLIEKELQNYEKLQRYSTQLEKGRLASSEEIALNWDAQWASLQKQLEMQEFRVEQRQQQLEMSRWIPFQLISGWDPTTDTLYENREVKFAWDLLIGFGQMMPMFGQVFGSLNQLYEDYDKRVTEAYEDRLEAEQAILDIQDERLELVKVGSEEATEFEEKILEALIQKEQEAIDELTAINDSITDANSKLLSTLQDKLDKLREQRENEKMEEELGEKERRLAYFRQNTGQGKLMDIKRLEEELEEGHESYTDQLIDQRIADLEKQNEKAAEQREKQIDLMQAQLDWSEKYGLYWDQIYGMLYVINDDGTVSMNLENFDLEGNLRTNGELSTLLNTFSDNIGKSIWSQLLENEELMRLGRYYQAFISRNGVTGEWGKYWALLNPGQDDPSTAYVNPWDSRDVGFLLKGILAIESAINRYFILSDYGLANMAGRIEAAFKNTIGKLFGIEEWANYKFEGYRADHVNAPISEGLYNIGTTIGIYEKEPDNSTYKSYGAETSGRISKTENVKDTMYDIDLYIGEIFDSTGDAIDALTGFFADLFSTVHNVL